MGGYEVPRIDELMSGSEHLVVRQRCGCLGGRLWIAALLWAVWALVGLILTGCQLPKDQVREADSDETFRRAVGFLRADVPAWFAGNGCHSCHNNGDAARALMRVHGHGLGKQTDVLGETLSWLRNPAGWDKNKGDPGFSDQVLADIQFASALAEAGRNGLLDGSKRTREAHRVAAARVVAAQSVDGSWQIEPQNVIGSPATYGPALATYMAWSAVKRLDGSIHPESLSRAADWLARLEIRNIPSASVVLLAGSGSDHPGLLGRLEEAAVFLKRTMTQDGGWGPYPDAPAEVFDTAMALLALSTLPRDPEADQLLKRGRSFLKRNQEVNGSWPPTTRPSGGASYAQRMSTTGWAMLAWLESDPGRRRLRED